MWVSQQMEHSDWAFTAKTYAKFIPTDPDDNGGKMMKRWNTVQMLSNEVCT